MDQRETQEIVNKTQHSRSSRETFSDVVLGAVTSLLGMAVGSAITSWISRRKFEKKLKQAIELLSAEEQKKVTIIREENKANHTTFRKKIKEYLESKGIDTNDLPD